MLRPQNTQTRPHSPNHSLDPKRRPSSCLVIRFRALIISLFSWSHQERDPSVHRWAGSQSMIVCMLFDWTVLCTSTEVNWNLVVFSSHLCMRRMTAVLLKRKTSSPGMYFEINSRQTSCVMEYLRLWASYSSWARLGISSNDLLHSYSERNSALRFREDVFLVK